MLSGDCQRKMKRNPPNFPSHWLSAGIRLLGLEVPLFKSARLRLLSLSAFSGTFIFGGGLVIASGPTPLRGILWDFRKWFCVQPWKAWDLASAVRFSERAWQFGHFMWGERMFEKKEKSDLRSLTGILEFDAVEGRISKTAEKDSQSTTNYM